VDGDIAASLRRLEDRGELRIDSLGENEAFIDTVFQATQAALSTSQEAKRRALRNVVLNAALPGAPDVTIQHVFVNLINEFTDWHLLVLRFIQNPAAWRNPAGGSARLPAGGGLGGVLSAVFPGLAGTGLMEQIWADLHARGLHRSGSLNTMMTGDGLRAKRTTELGDRFLAFITDPTER
jgi:hypothetical protein